MSQQSHTSVKPKRLEAEGERTSSKRKMSVPKGTEEVDLTGSPDGGKELIVKKRAKVTSTPQLMLPRPSRAAKDKGVAKRLQLSEDSKMASKIVASAVHSKPKEVGGAIPTVKSKTADQYDYPEESKESDPPTPLFELLDKCATTSVSTKSKPIGRMGPERETELMEGMNDSSETPKVNPVGAPPIEKDVATKVVVQPQVDNAPVRQERNDVAGVDLTQIPSSTLTSSGTTAFTDLLQDALTAVVWYSRCPNSGP